jgi:hypothetical protein
MDADPGVPSSKNMANAMFPPNGMVCSVPSQGEKASAYYGRLKDSVVKTFVDTYGLPAVAHSGRKETWHDASGQTGLDITGNVVPPNIIFGPSRTWYVICAKCKAKGGLSIIARCKFIAPAGIKSGDTQLSPIHSSTFYNVVLNVYFHNRNCDTDSRVTYPNGCRLTQFPFDEIIGATYRVAIDTINAMDITRGNKAREEPKNATRVDEGMGILDNR